MGAPQGWAMVTAGPIDVGPLDEIVLGVGLLVVAFLTWAGVSGAMLLRRHARAAEEQSADGAGRDGGAQAGTTAEGVIVGVGLLLGLLVARWWWTWWDVTR